MINSFKCHISHKWDSNDFLKIFTNWDILGECGENGIIIDVGILQGMSFLDK